MFIDSTMIRRTAIVPYWMGLVMVGGGDWVDMKKMWVERAMNGRRMFPENLGM